MINLYSVNQLDLTTVGFMTVPGSIFPHIQGFSVRNLPQSTLVNAKLHLVSFIRYACGVTPYSRGINYLSIVGIKHGLRHLKSSPSSLFTFSRNSL